MDSRTAALAAVAIVFIVVAAALGYMYASVSSKYSSLQSSYSALESKYSSLQSAYGFLNSSYTALSSKLSSIESSYSSLSSEYMTQQPLVVLSQAMSHWNDIAIENVSLLAPQYLPNAVLDWVGGPLSGTYSGLSAIEGVWSKFFNLYETVYWYTIEPPAVTELNSSAYQVTGYAQFFVFPTAEPIHPVVLNVTEVLTYVNTSGGYKISHEVWKVKPIPISAVAPGYPSQLSLEEADVLELALSHWNDIAIENASLIITEYAPDATLHWIGGPLSGNYTGINEINATWTKFDNTYEYVTWYSLVPPTVTEVNATTFKVEAPLQFVVFPFPTSSNPHPVEFVLNVTEILYYQYNPSVTNYQIVNEYWIVKPLSIPQVAPGYTPGQYTGNTTSG